jgi:hypothetical protein
MARNVQLTSCCLQQLNQQLLPLFAPTNEQCEKQAVLIFSGSFISHHTLSQIFMFAKSISQVLIRSE